MRISEYYEGIIKDIALYINNPNRSNEILLSDSEELSNYLFQKHALMPIEFDGNGDKIEPKQFNEHIRASDIRCSPSWQDDVDRVSQLILVYKQIQYNMDVVKISGLTASTISFSFSSKDFEYTPEYIKFSVIIDGYFVGKLNEEQIRKEVEHKTSNLSSLVSWWNNDITGQNQELRSKITNMISLRKASIESNQNLVNSFSKMIGIPIEKVQGTIVPRIIQSEPPLNKPKITPRNEYQILREDVLDIVVSIDRQGQQFEKTPKSFSVLGEEDLRNHILSNLNVQFKGKATGETFSHKGKTDIYLHIDEGNILIGECKFWGGEKLYNDTIDQLLGYLTWRMNYGIMITFCNQKSFSGILEKAAVAISKHESYQGNFSKQSNTHFISKHTIPGDDGKMVEIHHLFYNLYIEK